MRSPALSARAPVAAGGFSTSFAPADLGSRPGRDVLARIRFGRQAPAADDPRDIHLPLAQFGPPRMELWQSALPVDCDWDDGIGFAHNGEIVFGHIKLLECELDNIAAATFRAYARLTLFLERMDYPCLLRCWNYLYDINRGHNDERPTDQERYKQFSLGRYQVLIDFAASSVLPAGTAIGMHEPGLLLYFLAARQPGRQVENPRQVSAFHYPRQYGPRGPSFSRAMLMPSEHGSRLLVSGTASVVGHATRHPHDAAAQLNETLANLQALLQQAAETGGAAHGWTPQTLKVYLRDPAHYEFARARLDRVLPAGTPIVCLEGAICRTDLQVEIEGVYAAATA
jgi:chorismate lyase/3-hydroxybenzoate synthase